MAKGWKLTWNAPKNAMVAKPLELSIERAKDPPQRVRIEVYESDAVKYEVDDYENALRKRKEAPKDDLIAKFEGTLAPRGGTAHGRLFRPESGGPQLTKTGGNDHVVITFEGSSKTFECGVPHNPGEEPVDGSSDGGFYEIYAKLFDATSSNGKVLASTDVHLVRRRTDLLLAVEPLNQCGASLGNNAMGKMVLKFFHGGNNATGNRQWGDIIIGTHEGNMTSKTVCSSGCNYTVLAMALRYMRRSKPSAEPSPGGEEVPAAKAWISMFDEFVEPVLDDAYKPFVKKSDFPKFTMPGKEIDKAAAALFKEHKKEWKQGFPKFKPDDVWEDITGPKLAGLQGCRETGRIPKHWWVPRLVWWVRQQAAQETGANPTDADDTVQQSTTRWEVTKRDGTEETFAATHPDGTPIMAHRMKTSMQAGDFIPKSLRVEPPYRSDLKKQLRLKVTQVGILSASSSNWATRLKKHLQRGLPAVAHVKSGRYLRDGMNAGGHYILVVGYRETGGVLRFIVNDPAGAKRLQYECFREEDVTPTETNRETLTSLEVEFAVSRGGAELGTGTASFEEAQLEAALVGRYPERVVPLTGAAAGISVKIVIEGGTSAAKTTNYSKFRYSVEVTSDGASTLTASRQKTTARRKHNKGKFTASGAASHTEGTLKIDLTFSGDGEKEKGTRLPRPWEDRVNGLVERRRHDSLFAIHLLEPTYPWEDGAAQWLVFDGKVQ